MVCTCFIAATFTKGLLRLHSSSEHPLTGRVRKWLLVATVGCVFVVYNVRGQGTPPPLPRLVGSHYVFSRSPTSFSPGYTYGWPLPYLRLPCSPAYESEWDYSTQPRWLTTGFTSGSFFWSGRKPMPLSSFSLAAVYANLFCGILIVALTGYWTQRRSAVAAKRRLANEQRRPRFGLGTLLAFAVILTVMLVAAQADLGFWRSPGGVIVWLLSGVLGFAVFCSLSVFASMLLALIRCVAAKS
jgi:hypothetical protein